MISADAPDEFERRYMDADRALVRERRRQPRWARVVMAGVVLWWLAQLVPVTMILWRLVHLPGAFWIALAYGVYLWACTALMVLGFLGGLTGRVVLSPSHLRVQQALLLAEIPVSAVREVTVETLGFRPPGTLLGNVTLRQQSYGFPWEKQALRVRWVDQRGRERTTWVRTRSAIEFHRALSRLLAHDGVTDTENKGAMTALRVEAGESEITETRGDEAFFDAAEVRAKAHTTSRG